MCTVIMHHVFLVMDLTLARVNASYNNYHVYIYLSTRHDYYIHNMLYTTLNRTRHCNFIQGKHFYHFFFSYVYIFFLILYDVHFFASRNDAFERSSHEAQNKYLPRLVNISRGWVEKYAKGQIECTYANTILQSPSNYFIFLFFFHFNVIKLFNNICIIADQYYTTYSFIIWYRNFTNN